MAWDDKNPAQYAVLERATSPAAAFGWGPENSYVSGLNKHGVWVHASDYNKNFPALSNVKVSASETSHSDTMKNVG